MTAVFLLVVLLVAVLATAMVAAPLRRASPRTWLVVMAAVPVLSLGLYQTLGTPAALDPAARRPVADGLDAATQVDPAEFAQAIAELRTELERNPEQPEGWVLLARSMSVQGDHAAAHDAYSRALRLVPDEPALMVEVAQSSAQAHPQNRFSDDAVALLQRALSLQPGNQRARWFLGVAQRQRGLDAEAAATWEGLLPQVDEATASSLRPQIAQAREAAGLPPLDQATAPAAGMATPSSDATAARGSTAAGTAAGGLRIRLSLAPGVAERVGPEATVFVMARHPDGPPMPVAAERHPVSALPLDIVLDDGDSPMPTQLLSQLDAAVVSARISARGTVERRADDVEAAPVRVILPNAGTVELVIGAE
ncbi:tetratricopeptide repeat protein [Luteimonas sp. MC1750]|uniref:tetratricopeptide repeat protein n=1 Tax=Luteimonas sp. MC1750 TaxID=2799326 RepID=UPI0018F0861A|nr:tetratricopeptide repeat protein [Luteimonas sp. MC1750]MBJ6984520.1 tetratricopeptide repeat protein [Luteimonas sp. MC1750]QQO04870.1 tetratricopeptide repeat protein [Luteimonas sp. MC1750]